GQFNFSLSEQPPKKVGAREIELETLADGINPQELLLDLARGMDEDRRDSTAVLEASFAEAPPPDGEVAEVREVRAPEPVAPAPEPPAPAAAAPPPVAAPPSPRPAPPPPPPPPAAPPAAPPVRPAAARPPASPRPAPAAEPSGPPSVLLVDDEADVRRILA